MGASSSFSCPVFGSKCRTVGLRGTERLGFAGGIGAGGAFWRIFPKSPRVVGVERARAIVAALPPFVARVGLFVNAAPDVIEAEAGRAMSTRPP